MLDYEVFNKTEEVELLRPVPMSSSSEEESEESKHNSDEDEKKKKEMEKDQKIHDLKN